MWHYPFSNKAPQSTTTLSPEPGLTLTLGFWHVSFWKEAQNTPNLPDTNRHTKTLAPFVKKPVRQPAGFPFLR